MGTMVLSPSGFITLVCTISVAFADTVPVLIWGSSSGSLSALNDSQARLMEAVSKSPLTLAFVEDKLSAEDISLCKAELEGSCFNYLSGIRTKSYSYVLNPLDRIEDVAQNLKYVYVDKNGKLDSEIPLKDATVVIVSLSEDPDLSREENLEKHDVFINQIYNEIISNVGSEKVLALYTGKSSGNLLRKARQAATAAPVVPAQAPSTVAPAAPASAASPAAPASAASPNIGKNGSFIFNHTEILIYFTNLTYIDSEQRSISLIAGDISISNKNETAFQVTMTTDGGDITFKVADVHGYWEVSDVQFKDNTTLRTIRTVGAAKGFSYYCGPNTTYIGANKTELTWANLQLQPSFSNLSVWNFSDPYNCVGFTSIPIWSGLFVTIVLLLIMSAGISWLMDIRTMDRFDDPKGKTIAINTLE